MLEMARKDAERLLRILNDLLDLARLESGDASLNRERAEPKALLQAAAAELQPVVTEQGQRLGCLVEPRLPQVLVDRQRIGYVLHNFITNALKHSPPGAEIRLRAVKTEDHEVRFSVADRGPGVPAEFQGRIFDRFFRMPGQKKSGVGLGLSIAREIVVAHGGRIGVRSKPGQGSEFYFDLAPADEADGVEPQGNTAR
jgi:NtrC-family two-component system sensor histidine kinase KinB